MSKKNPLAVITGGTSGIGAAYAMAFAKQKYDLLLIALDLPEETNFLIDQIEKKYGVSVKVLKADLSTQKDVSHIASYLKNQSQIDVLINCAGFGLGTTFETAQLAKEEAMVRLHCLTPMDLTRAVLVVMREKNKGRIINVSSFGSKVPMKKNVVYGSTKAFLTFFTESLSLELLGSGISVHAVLPGFVKTHFHDTLKNTGEKKNHWLLPWQTPDDVVIRSLHAFKKGKTIYISHWKYRFLLRLYFLLPKSIYKKIIKK
ncbi:MAG: SDR family NAD(P)-dependent oxidoreductase [Candidatus Nanoarchaeia archaeon]